LVDATARPLVGGASTVTLLLVESKVTHLVLCAEDVDSWSESIERSCPCVVEVRGNFVRAGKDAVSPVVQSLADVLQEHSASVHGLVLGREAVPIHYGFLSHQEVCILARALPLGLKQLKLTSKLCCLEDVQELFKALPESLQELDISEGLFREDRFGRRQINTQEVQGLQTEVVQLLRGRPSLKTLTMKYLLHSVDSRNSIRMGDCSERVQF